jgi:predicted SAM-dependent methyltransferase
MITKASLKERIRPWYYLFKAFVLHSSSGFCNFCNGSSRFIASGFALPNAILLDVEGAGRRNIICYRCGSDERTRQIIKYIASKDIRNEKILHFAPEQRVYESLIAAGGDVTVSDIDLDRYSGFSNLQKIDLNQNSECEHLASKFDYIVLNHVLEHLENHKSSLQRLRTYLRPGGKLILTTPVSNALAEHMLLAKLDSPRQRYELLMHPEHTILFSKARLLEDLKSIFSSVTMVQHADVFGSNLRAESLFVAQR